ncbi:hypothetical protein R50073_08560 [Maricurvus nonylphenolicus]|uniref:TonB-dependent receptor n=1 Tax=Maricurvus nonylphenolicus TaxID=1008307 RepID=UPI0036F34279
MIKKAFDRKYLPVAIAGVVLAADVPIAVAMDSVMQIEEVVITARKRDETLQDIPVTVQALDSDTLEAYATREFSDLNDQISGLSLYNTGSAFPNVTLRGIQGGSTNSAADTSVAIDLNGIPHSTPQLLRFSMFDVQSVEVLKGPQALYFGKNSPAGVIALATKDPTEEFYSEVQVGYENAAESKFGHVILSGPLNENWGARAGIRHMETEGYFDNEWESAQAGDDTGPNYDETVFVGTLQGTFDKGDVTFKVYSGDRSGGFHTLNQIIHCTDNTDISNPGDDCKLNDSFSTEGFVNDKSLAPSRFDDDKPSHDYQLAQYSMAINYELDDIWSVRSVTGFVDMENRFFGGLAGTPSNNPAFSFALASELSSEQISQEFRLSGALGDVDLMVGAYVDDRELVSEGALWIAEDTKVVPDSVAIVEGESWSVFAQADFDLTENLELSVGARYTDEDRSFEGRNYESLALGGPLVYLEGDIQVTEPKLNYTDLSPEVSLTWHATESLTLFASYREGFKSGGYDASPQDFVGSVASTHPALGGDPVQIHYDAEQVKGFELGAKMVLADNTLRLNASVFAYDYEDLQQPSVFSDGSSVVTRTVNAAEAEILGAELDLLWLTPVEGLTVTGNITFLDNTYKSYVSQCNEYQIFVEPGNCNVDIDNDLSTDAGGLLAGTGFDAQDRDGDPLRNAPDYSGSIGFNFFFQAEDGIRDKLNMMASFSDSYSADRRNTPWAEQDAYWLMNAGLGVYAEDGGWSVDLITKNLTDEVVLVNSGGLARSGDSSTPEAQAGVRNAPRQVMLQFTFRPDVLF